MRELKVVGNDTMPLAQLVPKGLKLQCRPTVLADQGGRRSQEHHGKVSGERLPDLFVPRDRYQRQGRPAQSDCDLPDTRRTTGDNLERDHAGARPHQAAFYRPGGKVHPRSAAYYRRHAQRGVPTVRAGNLRLGGGGAATADHDADQGGRAGKGPRGTAQYADLWLRL